MYLGILLNTLHHEGIVKYVLLKGVIVMDKFDFKCRPKVAWITVNRDCNFRCPWCYGEDTKYCPKDTMSLETAKELVQTSIEIGINYFDIIGGEPTKWPFLSEFNKYCKELGVTTCLVTNASLFGKDKYWNEYILNPCDEVSVSVKSTDKDEFKRITKSDSFSQTMKGIKRAVDYYKCGVSTVYNSLVGLEGLKKIAVDCRELGANYFVVDLCTPVIEKNEILKGFSIEPTQLAKDIMEMQPFLDKLYEGNIEIAIYIPLCLFPEQFIDQMNEKHQLTTVCQVYGRSGINFDTNGDVMLCNQLFDTIIAKKNSDYKNSQELMAHLNCASICSDYRKLLRYPDKSCSECRWRLDCRGGCLLNWTLYDSSICHAVAKS